MAQPSRSRFPNARSCPDKLSSRLERSAASEVKGPASEVEEVFRALAAGFRQLRRRNGRRPPAPEGIVALLQKCSARRGSCRMPPACFRGGWFPEYKYE